MCLSLDSLTLLRKSRFWTGRHWHFWPRRSCLYDPISMSLLPSRHSYLPNPTSTMILHYMLITRQLQRSCSYCSRVSADTLEHTVHTCTCLYTCACGMIMKWQYPSELALASVEDKCACSTQSDRVIVSHSWFDFLIIAGWFVTECICPSPEIAGALLTSEALQAGAVRIWRYKWGCGGIRQLIRNVGF